MKNYIIQKIRVPVLQKLNTIIAFFLILVNIFPPLQALNLYKYTSSVGILMWLFCAALLHVDFFTNLTLHKLSIFCFIIYTFFFPYFFGNSTISHRYLAYGQIFIFYLIYQYNHSYGYDNSSKKILKWTLPFIVYSSIVTLSKLIEHPYLSRSIKSDGDYTIGLLSQGVGGYSFIYFLTFMSILLFFLILNRRLIKKHFFIQIIVFSLFLLFISTVIYSNYFTALIIIIVSIILMIVAKKRNVFAIPFFIITGIFLFFQWKNLFIFTTNFIIGILQSGKTLERIIYLQEDVLGNSGSGSLLDGRSPTLLSSWNTFSDNPITGLITRGLLQDNGQLIGFGQHSQFLDTFALYGIIIGLLNIYIVLQPLFKMVRKRDMLFSLNFAMLISTLIIFTMDNATPSIGFAIFFIYPLLCDLISEINRTSENKV